MPKELKPSFSQTTSSTTESRSLFGLKRLKQDCAGVTSDTRHNETIIICYYPRTKVFSIHSFEHSKCIYGFLLLFRGGQINKGALWHRGIIHFRLWLHEPKLVGSIHFLFIHILSSIKPAVQKPWADMTDLNFKKGKFIVFIIGKKGLTTMSFQPFLSANMHQMLLSTFDWTEQPP